MKTAIVECERLDEVKSLSDKATALRAYYAQSQDTENETSAMRIRLRAERRLGELIAQEQEAGRLANGNGRPEKVSLVATLNSIGIPRDRSARAQELARVPENQFEAALLADKPSARRLAELAPARSDGVKRAAPSIDVRPVLATWGAIRDMRAAIEGGFFLDPNAWSIHPGIQSFQVDEIRAAIPVVLAYLQKLKEQ